MRNEIARVPRIVEDLSGNFAPKRKRWIKFPRPCRTVRPHRGKSAVPNADRIMYLLSWAYDVSRRKIRAKNRKGKIPFVRQIAMHLFRSDLHWSLLEIASELKRKNHVTVLYGCRKIGSLLKRSSVLRLDVRMIRAAY